MTTTKTKPLPKVTISEADKAEFARKLSVVTATAQATKEQVVRDVRERTVPLRHHHQVAQDKGEDFLATIIKPKNLSIIHFVLIVFTSCISALTKPHEGELPQLALSLFTSNLTAIVVMGVLLLGFLAISGVSGHSRSDVRSWAISLYSRIALYNGVCGLICLVILVGAAAKTTL